MSIKHLNQSIYIYTVYIYHAVYPNPLPFSASCFFFSFSFQPPLSCPMPFAHKTKTPKNEPSSGHGQSFSWLSAAMPMKCREVEAPWSSKIPSIHQKLPWEPYQRTPQVRQVLLKAIRLTQVFPGFRGPFFRGVPVGRRFLGNHGPMKIPWKLSRLVGGWTNPLGKICERQIGFIFPKFRGENEKIFELPPPRVDNQCWKIRRKSREKLPETFWTLLTFQFHLPNFTKQDFPEIRRDFPTLRETNSKSPWK